jgi:hypothetical protein
MVEEGRGSVRVREIRSPEQLRQLSDRVLSGSRSLPSWSSIIVQSFDITSVEFYWQCEALSEVEIQAPNSRLCKHIKFAKISVSILNLNETLIPSTTLHNTIIVLV